MRPRSSSSERASPSTLEGSRSSLQEYVLSLACSHPRSSALQGMKLMRGDMGASHCPLMYSRSLTSRP